MAQYELLERIGKGGMAEIFRASQTAGSGFEKIVAIKRILPHLSEDQRFIELLIAEAKILSELHHRNIVQIYDVGLGDDGQYFLVIEFVDGTDLFHVYDDLFDGARLPVEVALHICSELCEALEHAHIAKDNVGNSLGLVHRDVSPSNVLLSKHGEVKLTDFGIAKRVEEVTGHGAVRGKFAYISPEQSVNQHVDGRSDVYSVGILLYELVCGVRLFSKYPDFDALREVRAGRVSPSAAEFDFVKRPLAEMIMRALSKEPAERFQSAGDFGSALRDYRYSLETEIADPRASIAALVTAKVRDGRLPATAHNVPEQQTSYEDDFSAEVDGATIVRISTAEQFNLTDLTGLHELVSSYPEPKFEDTSEPLGFESMDDAMTVAQVNPFLAGELARQQSIQGQAQSFDENVGSNPIARGDALIHSDALPPHRPPALPPPVSQPIPPQRLDSRGVLPSQRPSTASPPPAQPVSEQAPAFGYGPLASVNTGVNGEGRRRRIRLSLIAGSVGLLAFLVIGHFLSSSAQEEVDADSGVNEQPDAAVSIDAGLPDVDAARNRKGRKKKGRRKKRKGKKSRGK